MKRETVMVTKKENKSRVKVGKLKLNKETVKDLTDKEARRIKGGVGTATCNNGIIAASQLCGNQIASQAGNCQS